MWNFLDFHEKRCGFRELEEKGQSQNSRSFPSCGTIEYVHEKIFVATERVIEQSSVSSSRFVVCDLVHLK